MKRFAKLKQDFLIATKEAYRVGLEKCDFHDDCDFCNNPKLGTFAYGYFQGECDGYICGKCNLKRRNKAQYENKPKNKT